MKNKLLFTDVETTGKDGEIHGIHQISGIIDIEGEEVDRFNFNVRPFETDLIDTEALKASGVTYDQIMSYEDPLIVHEQLNTLLGKHVNKFNRNDKFHFLAYNSNFDNDHWRGFYKKCEDKYFGSFFFAPDICVMRLAAFYLHKERYKMINFKLKTVAEYLKIIEEDDETIKWHDSMVDIDITRQIYYKVLNGE